MLRSDFFYHLPPELIAQTPSEDRGKSRLLVCQKNNKVIQDRYFTELPNLIREKFCFKNSVKALLVANDSRVYPARVRVVRQTGAMGEVFLLETGAKKSYQCLLRPLSKLKQGEVLLAATDQRPLFKVTNLNTPTVDLIPDEGLDFILKNYGEMPLPPYIVRDPKRVGPKKDLDNERYQTVYSDLNKLGSAAAPTAGLHFTEEILDECKNMGIDFATVSLHVGLGTFAPVQAHALEEHPMHEEYYCINKVTFEKICQYLVNQWPIIYVGTTSLRAVESFFRHFLNDKQSIEQLALSGELNSLCLPGVDTWLSTKLYLYPNHKTDIILPHIGHAIITNFHQPESTLTMLIAALMGYDFWKEFYCYAVKSKYRFLSYGDSSLLIFK